MFKAKDYICDLTPYQPSLPLDAVARQYGLQPEAITQMASNENPIGPSPKAIEAVRRMLDKTNRYPDQYSLVHSIAAHHNLPPEQIAIGNGSNDILDIIARIYLGEGDEAISSRHSFAVYQIATRTAGAKNIVIDTKHNFDPDLKSVLSAVTSKTKVIWLDNPGNPTGSFTPYLEIKQLLNELPEQIILVLDEAYIEYLPEKDRRDAIPWLSEHPNLIITRTFSKMYGLAGMRVGYAIASLQIIELMNRVRHPFNVNVPAMVAAQAALQDQDFVHKSAALNHQGRHFLITVFNDLGLNYIKPHGNFVSVQMPNAKDVHQKLLQKGVIARPLAGYAMPEYLRITVGTGEENRHFANALREILS